MGIYEIKSRELLLAEEIVKTYPGVRALDSVSLAVHRGEVHAILGENGAGKSTLIKVLSGGIIPESGLILFDGTSYDGLTPAQAASLGILAVYQDCMLVSELTVAENMYLGSSHMDGLIYAKKQIEACASDVLNSLGIDLNPKEIVSNLSLSQKQFLAIARAVAQNVRLLILDEPTAALSSTETQHLFRIVRELKEKGISTIYISHRLPEIHQIADRVTILRDGRVVAVRNCKSLTTENMIRLMVGRDLDGNYPPPSGNLGCVAMEVKKLGGGKVHGVSFEVREGEILGISGLSGSGKTTLAKLLFGAVRKTSGTINVYGKPAVFASPTDAVAFGIGYVPANRKYEGILTQQTILHNLSLPILKKLTGLFGIIKNREEAICLEYAQRLQIKATSLQQQVGSLSGGNQQKVVVGKWLAAGSRILILDEPTQGMDVAAKQEVYRIIRSLTEVGTAVIMASSDMEELMGMSDRIVVMHEGGCAGILPRGSGYSGEEILALASMRREERMAI